MKRPIGLTNCLALSSGATSLVDLDAPTLTAVPFKSDRSSCHLWAVFCPHCEIEHSHGFGDGHREAHFNDASSPYYSTGYNLALKVD